jgi:hypothetical protein
MHIPNSFQVPREVSFFISSGCLKLIPLSRSLAHLDYSLVISNKEHLKGLFGKTDEWWPADNLSFAQNYEMLIWHEEQFENNESFAYAFFLNNTYIGCLYLYGLGEVYDIVSVKDPQLIYVFMWVDKELYVKGVDAQIFAQVKAWIEETWYFANSDYPGRLTPLTSFCRETASWILTLDHCV